MVDKTVEYFTFADPPAETVVSEITRQYQIMVDQSEKAAQNLALSGTSSRGGAPAQSNSVKDREIAQLKSQL